MRTEVKVGLIAGVVVIGAAVIFLLNKGNGTGQPADRIPWNANPEQAKKEGATAARDATKTPARSPVTPASRPSDKTDLTRRTLPPSSAGRPAERPPTATQPAPIAARQRTTLPPVAATQRSVVTPPAEPRIAAPGREATPEITRPAETRETVPAPTPPVVATPTSEPLRPRTTDTAAPATPPAEPRPTPATTGTAGNDEQPLRVGPLPRTPITPAPRTPAVAPTQPEPVTTPPASPGVAVPPRTAESMRVDDTTTRIRDAAKPKPEPLRYTVAESDTLVYIAKQKYGDGKYWTKIRDANPGINPDRLLVGQVLILPAKEEAPAGKPGSADAKSATGKSVADSKVAATEAGKPTTAADGKEDTKSDTKAARGGKSYTVGAGDTLATIARTVLNDGSRWREIYELNRDKIKNPDVLLEGTELKMPDNGAKAATSSTKTSGASKSPASGTKAPAADSKPSSGTKSPANGKTPTTDTKPAGGAKKSGGALKKVTTSRPKP